MQRFRSVISLATMFALTACGTIIHGSHQNIMVQSSPAGAKVETLPASGTFTTPTTLNLERKNSYTLNFTSPGYSPASFVVKNEISGGVLIGDILLGFVGVIVDAVTGAWYNLSPETATVSMTKTGSGPGPDEISVTISPSKDGGISISSDAPGVKIQVMESSSKH